MKIEIEVDGGLEALINQISEDGNCTVEHAASALLKEGGASYIINMLGDTQFAIQKVEEYLQEYRKHQGGVKNAN